MEVKDRARLRRMENFCRLNPDQAKLDKSARLIQEKLFTRLKLRREAAELRKKLKDLPQVCRSSFVKMHYLKAQTALLTTNVNLKLRK